MKAGCGQAWLRAHRSRQENRAPSTQALFPPLAPLRGASEHLVGIQTILTFAWGRRPVRSDPTEREEQQGVEHPVPLVGRLLGGSLWPTSAERPTFAAT